MNEQISQNAPDFGARDCRVVDSGFMGGLCPEPAGDNIDLELPLKRNSEPYYVVEEVTSFATKDGRDSVEFGTEIISSALAPELTLIEMAPPEREPIVSPPISRECGPRMEALRRRPEFDETAKFKKERFVPFPTPVLPSPIREFVMTVAEALGCNEAFLILPLLAALGSSVGTTRRIELNSTWWAPAIIWSLVIAESGTMKSPAQEIALSPLKQYQKTKIQANASSAVQYERDFESWENEVKNWEKTGRRDGDLEPVKPVRPSNERCIVNDITMAALVDRLDESPRGLLCACDEMATWFRNLGAHGSAARWIEMYGAKELTVDRKTGSKPAKYIPYAAVGVAGGIQPKTFQQVLRKSNIDNGLLARLLVVQPPRQKKVRTNSVVDPEIMRQVDQVFKRLLALGFRTDCDGQKVPVDIPLTNEGKAVWDEFRDEHATKQFKAEGAMAAMLSKNEGHAARLALILHLVRCVTDDPSVTPEAIDVQSVEAGITMAKWFAREAERVYLMLNENDSAHLRRKLAEWVESQGGSVTVRKTQQNIRRLKISSDAAKAALDELVKNGYGSWGESAPINRDGSSSPTFVLHPVNAACEEPTEERGCCGDVGTDSADAPPVPNDTAACYMNC